MITVGLRLGLELGLGIVFGLELRIVVYQVPTAEESDKMRINHGIKTDQWHAAPQIHPICICRIPEYTA